MIKVPQQAWSRIDAAINAAQRAHNDGVPPQFHERVTEYALVRDLQSKRLIVSAVRFGGAEVRVRRSDATESWRRFA